MLKRRQPQRSKRQRAKQARQRLIVAAVEKYQAELRDTPAKRRHRNIERRKRRDVRLAVKRQLEEQLDVVPRGESSNA